MKINPVVQIKIDIDFCELLLSTFDYPRHFSP